MKNDDVNFILSDLHKKIGITKIELFKLNKNEFILNQKYLIKLNDTPDLKSKFLIYTDTNFKYSLYKYKNRLKDGK
ncbi:MAG: hypothetical protein PHG03_04845 [Bacilli bacterium]|nr:hypothetical protein [Bacilli bacterium]